MEQRELEVFLTLAQELHFRRTAEKLHVSTASVSQMVAKLERRVGTPLFTRTSRQVELTAIGRRLVEDLTPAHAQIQAAVAAAVDAGRNIATRLRVGYMSAAVGRELLVLIDTFERAQPGCRVSITETALADLFGPLRRDEVDVCILPLPVREDDLCVGPVLLSEPATVALPRKHRFADRDELSLNELEDETLLEVDNLPDYWSDCHRAGSVAGSPQKARTQITGFQELLTFVEAGRGVAVVGAQSAGYYPRPGLVYVPVVNLAPFEYAAVWRASRYGPTAEAFVRHASSAQ